VVVDAQPQVAASPDRLSVKIVVGVSDKPRCEKCSRSYKMKVEMLMPQMGESIAEATISKWRKKPGDSVQKDEVILEISTDKVDSEIPAPAAGVLAELLFSEGDVVPVKTKIAVIDTAGSGDDKW
jgi:biotin carboxyl carrier protein